LDEDEGVEGFAQGGVAGWQGMANGFLRNRQRPLGSGSTAAPAPQGGFQYTRDAGGNVSNYNPGNPWGTMTQSTNPTAYGQSTRLLGGAGEAGYFDPRGNQMLIRSMQEGAQGDADALVRRQMTQSQVSGLDPAQAAAYKQQALMQTGRGVQDIMAHTRAQALGAQDDFYKQLMRDQYNADLSYILGEQGARNDRIRDQNQGRIDNKNSGGYFGRLGMNIAGSAAGALTGGMMGGGGVPQTRIAPNPDPGLHNLPRPN
jgi:hypothetical protein